MELYYLLPIALACGFLINLGQELAKWIVKKIKGE